MTESEGSYQWYVWYIKFGKFDVISKYIEDKVPEVKKVLFPTITTECQLKSGEAKKKKTPLYGGYMFLQYHHNPDKPDVWLKLTKHPFVSAYIGPCTPKDLVSVDSLQKLEIVNSDSGLKKFCRGDFVRVNGGVFKNFTGKVLTVEDKVIRVEIEAQNKNMKFVFSPEDLDITGGPNL